eukprot:TRINITY_DN49470_c0_g1_i1.p1 TRINITY_DN49470_c0_g1~~TRINITY_DN49470_c0_g1_i1.p1  ORF type:complete len:470 (+),score=73.71 TRINITY_DN49470_c0_g1_i1:52-1461(+)
MSDKGKALLEAAPTSPTVMASAWELKEKAPSKAESATLPTKIEESSDKPPMRARKPRIDCVDGCRFALVLPIVIAHFARFGTKNPTLLKLLTQENVLVGGFFVISGYVSGYTATKVGERRAEEKKLAKPELFFWQRVMAYYPLHFLMSTLFAPMFVSVERWYKTSWQTTSFRAFLNYTLLQAWFPAEAEIWNQPTWFLSALTFSNLVMPSLVLPSVASLSKQGLWKLFCGLTSISVLQKISYSETARFHSREVATTKPMHPLIWNLTRFHPFWALIEMTMGIAAVRDVMLDTEEDHTKKRTNPLVYFIASYATLALRITRFDFNDAIIRGTLFVPLFTKFLTAVHRDALSEKPASITRLFGSKIMTRLGGLAFPMFIVHGPIGQVFYKKAVAKRLWGRSMPTSFFPVYLLIVLGCSHLLNEFFVKSKRVQRWSAAVAQFLADRSEGMLQDTAAREEKARSSESRPPMSG